MITFTNNNLNYKIYFKHDRIVKDSKFTHSKIKRKKLKDVSYCYLEDSSSKKIIYQTRTECSYEDNFSKEIARQITLVRLLFDLFNNKEITKDSIKFILNEYFYTKEQCKEIQLPIDELEMLNYILTKIKANNGIILTFKKLI